MKTPAIAVTAAGSGYVVGDVLTISAGFAGAGSTARTITLQANDLKSVTAKSIIVTTPGTGHKVGDELSFTVNGVTIKVTVPGLPSRAAVITSGATDITKCIQGSYKITTYTYVVIRNGEK